jgi:hypothetical protein
LNAAAAFDLEASSLIISLQDILFLLNTVAPATAECEKRVQKLAGTLAALDLIYLCLPALAAPEMAPDRVLELERHFSPNTAGNTIP